MRLLQAEPKDCSGNGSPLFQPPPLLACSVPLASCRPRSKPGRRSPTAASKGTGQWLRRWAAACASARTARRDLCWEPVLLRKRSPALPGRASAQLLSSPPPLARGSSSWRCRWCRGSQRCPQPGLALFQVAGAEPARLRLPGSGRPAAAAGAALGEGRRGGAVRVRAVLLPAVPHPRQPALVPRVGKKGVPAAGGDEECRHGRSPRGLVRLQSPCRGGPAEGRVWGRSPREEGDVSAAAPAPAVGCEPGGSGEREAPQPGSDAVLPPHGCSYPSCWQRLCQESQRWLSAFLKISRLVGGGDSSVPWSKQRGYWGPAVWWGHAMYEPSEGRESSVVPDPAGGRGTEGGGTALGRRHNSLVWQSLPRG